MSSFFKDIFSKQKCGFRKSYSTQQWLVTLLEKWKNAVDKGNMFRALLTDISKAFDCLKLELLIAKAKRIQFYFTCFEINP